MMRIIPIAGIAMIAMLAASCSAFQYSSGEHCTQANTISDNTNPDNATDFLCFEAFTWCLSNVNTSSDCDYPEWAIGPIQTRDNYFPPNAILSLDKQYDLAWSGGYIDKKTLLSLHQVTLSGYAKNIWEKSCVCLPCSSNILTTADVLCVTIIKIMLLIVFLFFY